MPLADRLRASRAALHTIAGHTAIVRLVGALVLRWVGTSMGLVAYLIVAYQAAGPTGLAILGLSRMIPATVVAPLTGSAGRRYGHRRLLIFSHLLRGASAVASAVVLVAGLPVALVYACCAISAAAGALVRPLHGSMLPELAQAPDELIAANVASSAGEGAASLLGPTLGGLLVAIAGPGVAIALAGLLAFAAAALVASARVFDHASRHQLIERRRGADRATMVVLREHPGVLAIIAGFGAQTVVRGLLTTLIVVSSIELLGMGQVGVGLLNTAIGAGALVGAVGSIGLVGRRNLGGAFALVLTAWSLPIAALGAWPVPAVALIALAAVGLGNARLDIAGYTLLQRAVPSGERMGVLGVLEAVAGLGLALGSVLAPALIAIAGVRGALIVAGFALPVVALITWPRLAHIDEGAIVPERELALLRTVPLLAPLQATTLEDLARALTGVRFATGEVLMREGDPGDRFLVLASGRVEVTQGGSKLRECGPGEGLGEIALLRDIPRTATVRALEPTLAYALAPDAFISAITGNALTVEVADMLLAERLAEATG